MPKAKSAALEAAEWLDDLQAESTIGLAARLRREDRKRREMERLFIDLCKEPNLRTIEYKVAEMARRIERRRAKRG